MPRSIAEAPAATTSDVWKLVPVEPTIEMQNAGWREIDKQGFQTEDTEVAPIYRAMLASAPASPAIGIQAVTLDFHAADTTPDVPRGQMKACIIMMRSRHTGKNFTMPAYYLNAYPLEFEDGCGDEKCEDEHDDGCPVTGWFYDNANFEYENCYYRIEGECLAWALIPDAASVEAALHPAPEAASPAAAGEVEATAIIREMVRLADIGFEASLREPEENGNYAVYERAKRFLASSLATPSDTAPSPKGVSDGVREAVARVLAWVQPIAGDNFDPEAAAEEEESIAELLAALSQEHAPGRKESQ